MEIKKVVIAGGSGYLGKLIIKEFENTETEIIVLTRGNNKKLNNILYVNWDGKSIGEWVNHINNADVLINLTGKSVDCRYTEKNKKEIISSRVDATTVLGNAINKVNSPPKLWINASGAAIYNNTDDKPSNESSPLGSNEFMADVSKQWEKAFNEVATPITRKIIIRITLVLGNGGGVWPVFSRLVKFGLGGKMGSGKQFISWIHEADFINIILWIIKNENAKGIYNIAAPKPELNKDFMKIMRNQYNKAIGLPATAWMIKLGAFILGTEAELILKSRNVHSKKLIEEGYSFLFNTVNEAAADLIKHKK